VVAPPAIPAARSRDASILLGLATFVGIIAIVSGLYFVFSLAKAKLPTGQYWPVVVIVVVLFIFYLVLVNGLHAVAAVWDRRRVLAGKLFRRRRKDGGQDTSEAPPAPRPDVEKESRARFQPTERIMSVQFPERALSTAGSDVLAPLKELQQGLGILPADADLAKSGAAAAFTGPPDSVAIIQAGATALSKWWSVVIAGIGGTAAITSVVTNFWSGQTGGVRIALIGGMAGLLIAALIAISVIVAADVKGRAQGTVALYAARASLAAQFLQDSLSASRPATAATPGNPPAPPGESATPGNAQTGAEKPSTP
jgi:energy-coupling factor transporter transmembrane protein EcfT